MVKHILLFLGVLLFFIFGSKHIESKELTDNQVKAEVLWQVTQVIDMLQTIEIAEHGDRWVETNNFLGSDPSTAAIIPYFAIRHSIPPMVLISMVMASIMRARSHLKSMRR